MQNLSRYSGNVYRFKDAVMAQYGNRPVSIIGVNQPQDHLVIGGYRDDFLVPISEVTIPEDQQAALKQGLERARRIIPPRMNGS